MDRRRITIDYYASKFIDDLLFDSEKDAEEFDNALEEFCEFGDEEWNNANRQYASEAAVDYAINISGRFHFNLEGPYSDRLLAACESSTEEDCYRSVMNYLNKRM